MTSSFCGTFRTLPGIALRNCTAIGATTSKDWAHCSQIICRPTAALSTVIWLGKPPRRSDQQTQTTRYGFDYETPAGVVDASRNGDGAWDRLFKRGELDRLCEVSRKTLSRALPFCLSWSRRRLLVWPEIPAKENWARALQGFAGSARVALQLSRLMPASPAADSGPKPTRVDVFSSCVEVSASTRVSRPRVRTRRAHECSPGSRRARRTKQCGSPL